MRTDRPVVIDDDEPDSTDNEDEDEDEAESTRGGVDPSRGGFACKRSVPCIYLNTLALYHYKACINAFYLCNELLFRDRPSLGLPDNLWDLLWRCMLLRY